MEGKSECEVIQGGLNTIRYDDSINRLHEKKKTAHGTRSTQK